MRHACWAMVVAVVAASWACSSAEGPRISLNRTELNFGGDFGTSVFVEASSPDSLEIRNAGDQDLVISGVEVTGTHAAEFEVTIDPVGTLAPGKTVVVEVTVTPLAPGLLEARLVVSSNATNRGSADVPIEASAVWRYHTVGLVTSSDPARQPLPSIAVSCLRPSGASCSGDSDCAAEGRACVEGSCGDRGWKGWSAKTGADGRFEVWHLWPCGDLRAEDSSGAYAATSAPWSADKSFTVEMSKN